MFELFDLVIVLVLWNVFFCLSNDGKYMWLNRVNDEYGMEIKNSRFGLIRTETGVLFNKILLLKCLLP